MYPIFAMLLFSEMIRSLEPQAECNEFSFIFVSFIVDIFWSLISNVFILNATLKFLKHTQIISLVCVVLFALHSLTVCAADEPWIFTLRAILFYVCNFLIFNAPIEDNMIGKDRDLVIFVSLHLLFVHPYVIIGSTLALAGLFWHTYTETFLQWGRRTTTDAISHKSTFLEYNAKIESLEQKVEKFEQLEIENANIAIRVEDDPDDLLQQLHNAKRMMA